MGKETFKNCCHRIEMVLIGFSGFRFGIKMYNMNMKCFRRYFVSNKIVLHLFKKATSCVKKYLNMHKKKYKMYLHVYGRKQIHSKSKCLCLYLQIDIRLAGGYNTIRCTQK